MEHMNSTNPDWPPTDSRRPFFRYVDEENLFALADEPDAIVHRANPQPAAL
jgi:hypothetical protein